MSNFSFIQHGFSNLYQNTQWNKYNYDTLYINGQAHIEGYQSIDEAFKNKMMN